MTHYVAILEDRGPEHAIGVWFPDLEGCFSAGDTLDEAMRNAPEALALWMEHTATENVPRARTLSELRADPDISAQIHHNDSYMVALIPYFPARLRPAAE